MGMPSDSKKRRYNLRNKNKKDKDKEKQCKSHSGDGDNKPDDDDDEEFNNMDYKKFLQKIFPSKHLDEQIKNEEKQKSFNKLKKNSSKKENTETVYLEEEFVPYKQCSVNELKNEIKNRGIKGVKSSNKKELIKILEAYDEEYAEEEDSEYETEDEYDEDDEEDDEIDGKQFNIVFTIGNPPHEVENE